MTAERGLECACHTEVNEDLLVVLDQGENVEAGEFFAAVEECEFDGEGQPFDFTAQFLDET